MDWGMLAAVLDHMRDRLEAGARADLLEMTQVIYVKSWTARLLRDNGFRNVRALAEAEPKDLVPVLMMVRFPGFLLYNVSLTVFRSTLAKHRGVMFIRRRQSGMRRNC